MKRNHIGPLLAILILGGLSNALLATCGMDYLLSPAEGGPVYAGQSYDFAVDLEFDVPEEGVQVVVYFTHTRSCSSSSCRDLMMNQFFNRAESAHQRVRIERPYTVPCNAPAGRIIWYNVLYSSASCSQELKIGWTVGSTPALDPRFSISPAQPRPGQTINLNDLTEFPVEPIQRKWLVDGIEVGDGRTTSLELAEGEYKVRLEILAPCARDWASTEEQLSVSPHVESFRVRPIILRVDEECRFDASTVARDLGTDVSFEWDFGDGQWAEGISVAHRFRSHGSYTVQLTVRSSTGQPASWEQRVFIHPARSDSQTAEREGAQTLFEGSFPVVRSHAGDTPYVSVFADVKNLESEPGKKVVITYTPKVSEDWGGLFQGVMIDQIPVEYGEDYVLDFALRSDNQEIQIILTLWDRDREAFTYEMGKALVGSGTDWRRLSIPIDEFIFGGFGCNERGNRALDIDNETYLAVNLVDWNGIGRTTTLEIRDLGINQARSESSLRAEHSHSLPLTREQADDWAHLGSVPATGACPHAVYEWGGDCLLTLDCETGVVAQHGLDGRFARNVLSLPDWTLDFALDGGSIWYGFVGGRTAVESYDLETGERLQRFSFGAGVFDRAVDPSLFGIEKTGDLLYLLAHSGSRQRLAVFDLSEDRLVFNAVMPPGEFVGLQKVEDTLYTFSWSEAVAYEIRFVESVVELVPYLDFTEIVPWDDVASGWYRGFSLGNGRVYATSITYEAGEVGSVHAVSRSTEASPLDVSSSPTTERGVPELEVFGIPSEGLPESHWVRAVVEGPYSIALPKWPGVTYYNEGCKCERPLSAAATWTGPGRQLDGIRVALTDGGIAYQVQLAEDDVLGTFEYVISANDGQDAVHIHLSPGEATAMVTHTSPGRWEQIGALRGDRFLKGANWIAALVPYEMISEYIPRHRLPRVAFSAHLAVGQGEGRDLFILNTSGRAIDVQRARWADIAPCLTFASSITPGFYYEGMTALSHAQFWGRTGHSVESVSVGVSDEGLALSVRLHETDQFGEYGYIIALRSGSRDFYVFLYPQTAHARVSLDDDGHWREVGSTSGDMVEISSSEIRAWVPSGVFEQFVAPRTLLQWQVDFHIDYEVGGRRELFFFPGAGYAVDLTGQ